MRRLLFSLLLATAHAIDCNANITIHNKDDLSAIETCSLFRGGMILGSSLSGNITITFDGSPISLSNEPNDVEHLTLNPKSVILSMASVKLHDMPKLQVFGFNGLVGIQNISFTKLPSLESVYMPMADRVDNSLVLEDLPKLSNFTVRDGFAVGGDSDGRYVGGLRVRNVGLPTLDMMFSHERSYGDIWIEGIPKISTLNLTIGNSGNIYIDGQGNLTVAFPPFKRMDTPVTGSSSPSITLHNVSYIGAQPLNDADHVNTPPYDPYYSSSKMRTVGLFSVSHSSMKTIPLLFAGLKNIFVTDNPNFEEFAVDNAWKGFNLENITVSNNPSANYRDGWLGGGVVWPWRNMSTINLKGSFNDMFFTSLTLAAEKGYIYSIAGVDKSSKDGSTLIDEGPPGKISRLVIDSSDKTLNCDIFKPVVKDGFIVTNELICQGKKVSLAVGLRMPFALFVVSAVAAVYLM